VGHRARPRGATVLIVAGHRLLSRGWAAAARPVDEDLRRQYACRCASVAGRRSMLADVA
jgi:hypothetical protein